MKLQTKATLVFLLGTLILLAAADIAFIYALRMHVSFQVENYQRFSADNWAGLCRDSLERDDVSGLPLAAQGFTRDQTMLFAWLEAPDRTFLFHSDPALLGRDVAPWSEARERDGAVLIRRPIVLAGKTAGVAGLSFSGGFRDVLFKSLRHDVVPPLMVIDLTIALIVLSLSFAVTRVVIRPVKSLAAAAREVGRGRLETRVPVEGSDEIGLLQREFNSMTQGLSEVERLKTEFLAKITHDLRNPLGAVRGYVEMVAEGWKGPVNPEQERCLRVSMDSADFLTELIDNILDLTKLEAGRMDFKRVPMDLAEVVGASVRLLEVKASEYKVSLRYDGPPSPLEILSDPQALQRVCVNLVSNALKFTPEGGSVVVRVERQEGESVAVSVSDTGVGIPADRLGQVFSKFVQLHSASGVPRSVKGTGLGLAVCKELVEGLGGKIRVESVQGKGTTFRFTLPAGELKESSKTASPCPDSP